MNGKNVKITIITVTCNAVRTIEQAIVSVINQDYPNIEYIIVDGASTDGTVDIIRKYEKSIFRWLSEPDTGIYNAMNKAVKLSTGKYIYFLGSDDCLFSNDVIGNVVKQLLSDIDILSGYIWLVDSRSKRQILCTNNHALIKEEFNGTMIPHQGMFVRKQLLLKNPFDEKYRVSADYKFFLQCYYDESIKFKYVDFPVAYMESCGASSNGELVEKENILINMELKLPFYTSERWIYSHRNRIKKFIKEILINLKIWDDIRNVRKICHSRKHRCSNPICRWCGRSPYS